ncbi:MAG: thioredoxin family protein [Paramuribaculum sp.]|nr:thioredoxin family protein [Paramuribaculum sp.]
MKSLVEKIKESVPTLVVFQHAGNQDAVEVKYLLQELRAKYGDRVSIVRVDASYNGEYKVHYKLEEYPTFILFKDGQELMRESGRKTLGELEDMLGRAFN